jgi:Lar family restriction alleviation protein
MHPRRCPFCLANETSVIDDDDRVEHAYVVACPACGAQGPVAITRISAIELWNARRQGTPARAQLE